MHEHASDPNSHTSHDHHGPEGEDHHHHHSYVSLDIHFAVPTHPPGHAAPTHAPRRQEAHHTLYDAHAVPAHQETVATPVHHESHAVPVHQGALPTPVHQQSHALPGQAPSVINPASYSVVSKVPSPASSQPTDFDAN